MAVDIYNFPELVSSIFFLIFSVFFIFIIGKSIKLTANEIILIFSWHSIFALFFMLNDLGRGHDASGWYNNAKISNSAIYGNSFMYTFSFILKSLKINYIAQNLLYNVLGTVVIFIFYSKLKELCKYQANKNFFILASIFIFLPGLSFWSSGITKDSISIFGFAILYYSINNKFSLYLFLLGVLAILFSRPFLAFFFVVGLYLYLLFEIVFEKKQKFFKKLIRVIFLIILAVPLLLLTNVGFSYMAVADGLASPEVNFNVFSIIEIILDFVKSSQNYYINTNTGIPADTFILFRYLYFLFMPITTQYNGILFTYFVLENIFLIFLFLIMIKNINFYTKGINKLTKIYYISIFILFLTLPLIFSNYGIALRYKWLIIPYFLLAFLDFRNKVK